METAGKEGRSIYKSLVRPTDLRLICMVLLTFLCLAGCSQVTPCDKLPGKFPSYQQAKKSIESASFKFVDHANTAKSSWIRGADYYSCDGEAGYLILSTDDNTYLYANLPVEVWKGFKNAESHGTYYNRYIKGRYGLPIAE